MHSWIYFTAIDMVLWIYVFCRCSGGQLCQKTHHGMKKHVQDNQCRPTLKIVLHPQYHKPEVSLEHTYMYRLLRNGCFDASTATERLRSLFFPVWHSFIQKRHFNGIDITNLERRKKYFNCHIESLVMDSAWQLPFLLSSRLWHQQNNRAKLFATLLEDIIRRETYCVHHS